MSDTKISALTSLAGSAVDPAADVFPIVDTSVTTTKKITPQEVLNTVNVVSVVSASSVTAANDFIPVYVAADSRTGKITVNQLKSAMAISAITLGTEQATTSGTAIDFTVPSGTKRITVMFKGVSTNGTSNLLLQIGPSGGVETSGYSSVCYAGAVGTLTSTAGFLVTENNAAANVMHGAITLSLENSSAFSWVSAGNLFSAGSNTCDSSAGSKSAAAEVVKLRLTTVNGTDAFDAGAVNIQYE